MVGKFAQESGHEDGVAGVIEFKFVDADECFGGELGDSVGESECANEVGVFDEGAKGCGVGAHVVGEGREEVGFSDSESAVEVEGGWWCSGESLAEGFFGGELCCGV